LSKYAQDQLLSFGDRVELITPTEERSRGGVNGFRIKGFDFSKFYAKCAEAKVRIRMVQENSLNSVRVSTHIYNNTGEVDKLMEVVKKEIDSLK